MPFVAARCPQCGGDLQLDNAKETGFCMHCGSKIIVHDAIRVVRVDNTHMVDNWMKMGQSAFEAGNINEAYNYFTKVVEVDPNNWKALYSKGKAAGYLSTIAKPRFPEFIQGISASMNVIYKSGMAKDELSRTGNIFADDLYNLIEGFEGLFGDIAINNMGRDTFFDTDWDFMNTKQKWNRDAIEYCKIAINLIDEFTDEVSKSNKIKSKKDIISYCCAICSYDVFYLDYSKQHLSYFGYTANEKKPFIDLYEQLIMEVRREEPNYWNDKSNFIDRLDTPKTIDQNKGRRERLEALEKEIDIKRRATEAVSQKQKYWVEHPEEYKTCLNEINDKSAQLQEMGKNKELEIKKLKNVRGKLGILAGKQKKEIDEKIIALENDYTEFMNRIKKLKKQLGEL